MNSAIFTLKNGISPTVIVGKMKQFFGAMKLELSEKLSG